MQVCTSLKTDNHTSTHHSSFFTGWMPFLPPNQQRQSNEGLSASQHASYHIIYSAVLLHITAAASDVKSC